MSPSAARAAPPSRATAPPEDLADNRHRADLHGPVRTDSPTPRSRGHPATVTNRFATAGAKSGGLLGPLPPSDPAGGFMRISRRRAATLTALTGLALGMGVIAPTAAGAAVPTATERAICEDLFGGVFPAPSSEPLAQCQWDMAIIDADGATR